MAILVALVLLVAVGAGAGDHRVAFENLTTEDGLSNNVVFWIAQDTTGFLWFGAKEGLNRYDGYRFIQFQHDPHDPRSMSEEDVSCIEVGADGEIWIATWGGGLNRFDPVSHTFEHFLDRAVGGDGAPAAGVPASGAPAAGAPAAGVPGPLRDNRVQVLYEDRDGILWAGTFGGGLSRFDRAASSFTTYLHDPAEPASISSNRIWAIAEDAGGTLWIGTDNGLDRFDRTTATFHRHTSTARTDDSNIVRALCLDRAGTLWAGTEVGLFTFDTTDETFARCVSPADEEAGLRDTPGTAIINTIIEDHDGNLWVGSNGSGLFRIAAGSGEVTRYSHDYRDLSSLANNDVRCLYEDTAHVLWIATRGGGISKLDLKPEKFEIVHCRPDDPDFRRDVWTHAFYQDLAGVLWIGTSAGFARASSDLSRFTFYRHDPDVADSLPDDRVHHLAGDRRGFIWIGTWRGGLTRFDPEQESFVTYRHDPHDPDSLANDIALSFLEDSYGELWVGTTKGLDRFDRERGVFLHHRAIPGRAGHLRDDYVWTVFEDSRGELWFGTDGGLHRYDRADETFTCFRSERDDAGSLSHDRVKFLYEDEAGILWVGTANGLNAFDRDAGTFTRYLEKDGLLSAHIYGILGGAEGQLWLSTNRGLSRFDPATETFRNYTVSDGLQSSMFSRGAALETAGGSLLFGGIRGFCRFLPEEVVDNPHLPPVVLTGFRRFDEPVWLGLAVDRLDEIVLSYRESYFTIEFAALDFTDPARNRYAYQLVGRDRDWLDAGTRNQVSYSGLEPGEYVLRFKGSNSDGLWNEQGTAVAITVTPPFWRTAWFRVLAGLLLAAAVWGAHRLRVRSIEQQRRRLEEQVARRTSELREKRDHLEKINEVVKAINSEVVFADLATAILEQMRVIRGMERGAVAVRNPETGSFTFRAALGWPLERLQQVELDEQEAQHRYVDGSEELFDDIFVTKGIGERRGKEKFAGLQIPQSLLSMRIRVEDQVQAYVVLDNMHDQDAFDEQDIQLLRGLKEHIVSAFIKVRMLQELKVLNEKKNELLGVVAHDLRSPLGIISAWTTLTVGKIRGGRFDQERTVKDLERVITVSDSLTRLVTELLDISAIEAGKINLELRRENLAPILDECVHLYRDIAGEKEISLAVEPNGDLPDVLADRGRITEVIGNLLSNAIKFTHPGGHVRVSCESQPREVVTHVSDDGQGLSEDDLQLAFRSFKKLSARPTAGESSTGFGLAIVKKIIELHGGRVWVESTKGEGSRFSFSLPTVA